MGVCIILMKYELFLSRIFAKNVQIRLIALS